MARGGGLGSAVRKLRWSVAQRGVWGTAKILVRRLFRGHGGEEAVHPFDIEFGVETSGFIGGGELDSEGDNAKFVTAYYGVAPSRLREALAAWSTTPGTVPAGEVTFLDIGCGKGRAMMVASETGFREVVGVELNAGLAEIADRNLQRWGELGRAKSSMRVLCGDALQMELPPGPLLVYLYNPFTAVVLRELLKRLDGLAGVDVLYVRPEQNAVFEEFPRYGRLWEKWLVMSEEDRRGEPGAIGVDGCELYRSRK